MLETFYEMILKSIYICLHGVLSWPLWYNIHTPETENVVCPLYLNLKNIFHLCPWFLTQTELSSKNPWNFLRDVVIHKEPLWKTLESANEVTHEALIASGWGWESALEHEGGNSAHTTYRHPPPATLHPPGGEGRGCSLGYKKL